MTRLRLTLPLVLALAGALGVARGQEAPAQPGQPPVDPFATPPSMRRAQVDGGVGAVGTRSWLAGLPPVAVLATIEVTGRPAGALLALGDLRRVVRAGDRLTLLGTAGLEVLLEVLAIDAAGVQLRIGGADGQTVVLK